MSEHSGVFRPDYGSKPLFGISSVVSWSWNPKIHFPSPSSSYFILLYITHLHSLTDSVTTNRNFRNISHFLNDFLWLKIHLFLFSLAFQIINASWLELLSPRFLCSHSKWMVIFKKMKSLFIPCVLESVVRPLTCLANSILFSLEIRWTVVLPTQWIMRPAN